MRLTGEVWKYGDNVDTDVIIPARYLNVSTPEELARHCMEDIDPDFAAAVRPGDIIVGGENFGCGSSREHAPLAIKGAGISCVIANSFARIFYRNAINVGLPILECTEAVDLEAGVVTNERTGRTYQTSPFPPFILGIIEAGGLVPYTRRRIKSQPEPDFGEPSARAQAEGSVEPSKGDFCSAGPENPLEITLRRAQDDFSPTTKMRSCF
jgi:3-isopropylmalate/(R)-2-methylmalate dehydratase small subunit